MKLTKPLLLILYTLSSLGSVFSERILFLLPISSRSHKNVFDPLIKALAKKGHDVISVSAVKSSNVPPNVHEIIPVPTEEIFKEFLSPFEARKLPRLKRIVQGTGHIVKMCHKIYENEEVKALLKNGTFDLVIVSGIGNHCFFGMIPIFQAPVMALLTLPASNFNTEKLGTHLPPSFIPLSFLDFTENMTFRQRVVNTGVQWLIRAAEVLYYRPLFNSVKNQYHGEDWPQIGDIERNFSMLMVNSHYAMNPLVPLLPDIVEVGGMHCRPAQPLPEELNDWLSEGEDGFIYMSFGSIIQANTMPEEYRKIFVNVFSKLKQRVLWKWETEDMPDLPSNVKLSKWLPQQDILGSPHIRMFISHGGLLSTQEAIYHSVPLVGIPFFSDQDLNTAQAQRLGFAKKLEILELTEDILENAINAILVDKKFQARADQLSNIFRDQPQTALQRALFSAEYVMRHKGALHLRSPARNLSLIQYHSYDVTAFLVIILILILWVFKKLIFLFIRLCCRKKVSNDKKKRE